MDSLTKLERGGGSKTGLTTSPLSIPAFLRGTQRGDFPFQLHNDPARLGGPKDCTCPVTLWGLHRHLKHHTGGWRSVRKQGGALSGAGTTTPNDPSQMC